MIWKSNIVEKIICINFKGNKMKKKIKKMGAR